MALGAAPPGVSGRRDLVAVAVVALAVVVVADDVVGELAQELGKLLGIGDFGGLVHRRLDHRDRQIVGAGRRSTLRRSRDAFGQRKRLVVGFVLAQIDQVGQRLASAPCP
ncbi:MAG: hypothetical protein U1F37_17710 [Alphaproteobacteria bacterium]